jgi:hypothetical protein
LAEQEQVEALDQVQVLLELTPSFLQLHQQGVVAEALEVELAAELLLVKRVDLAVVAVMRVPLLEQEELEVRVKDLLAVMLQQTMDALVVVAVLLKLVLMVMLQQVSVVMAEMDLQVP